MPRKKSSRQRSISIQRIKLVAIKQECYALSGAATTQELKRKHVTLSKNRDFRKRKTWEYVLKQLRYNGDWLGVSVSELEALAEKQREAKKPILGTFVFHPERVAMDQSAENDN